MIELDKTYEVTHTRKGTFVARVTALDETWATMQIVQGEAVGMRQWKIEGEFITVRRSFCTFKEHTP